MISFEQTKQFMQGHTVTVTSWFDPQKQVWRASAPAYVYMIHDWPSQVFGRSQPGGCCSLQIICRLKTTVCQR